MGCYKQAVFGTVLHVLLSCTSTERVKIAKALCMICHGLDAFDDVEYGVSKDVFNTEGAAGSQTDSSLLVSPNRPPLTLDHDVAQRYFDRYDFDGSGTLNNTEEFNCLVTNMVHSLN